MILVIELYNILHAVVVNSKTESAWPKDFDTKKLKWMSM